MKKPNYKTKKGSRIYKLIEYSDIKKFKEFEYKLYKANNKKVKETTKKILEKAGL